MPCSKRAALLARVSSQAQGKADRLGIPVQLEAGRAYAERMGFEIGGVYTDQISGASESREAFYRLLAEADSYDLVIIYDLTRLARSEELSYRFMRLLNEAGLEVHSSTRGLLTNDVQTGIEIILSAEERRKIFARTSSARIAIARRGELPVAMQGLGYTHVKRKAIVVPNEAELAYRIFEMSAQGSSFRDVARTLHAEGVSTVKVMRGTGQTTWNPAVVARIVQNPMYKGIYRWDYMGQTYEIPVPSIVSESLWEAAQKPRRGPPGKLSYPLSGHLVCGLCGARLSSRRYFRKRKPTHTGSFREWYRCNNSSRSLACKLPGYARSRLEPVVEAELRRIMTDEAILRQYLEAERPLDPAKVTERAHLEREDGAWLEAFREGAIDALELATYRKEIKSKLRVLEQTQDADSYLPVEEYRYAAESMSLKELVDFASVTVIVQPDGVHIKLG